MQHKKCVVCGTEFKPRQKNQKLCGNSNCRRIYNKQWVQARRALRKEQGLCVICGKPAPPGKTLCSISCAKKYSGYSKRKQKVTTNTDCSQNTGTVVVKDTIRPFSYTTNLMIADELLKGKPAQEAAKIIAYITHRDYMDTLDHTNKLINDGKAQKYIDIIKTTRGVNCQW